VRAFACPRCRSLVFFENSMCVTCGSALAFDRASAQIVSLVASGTRLVHVDGSGREFGPCANLASAGCNWLAATGAGEDLCGCCELTRTRPPDEDEEAVAAFARAEAAKRRLLFQLDGLGLPTTSRRVDPTRGLAFDLLSSRYQPVTTGHDGGVITIDLAEGDDAHREWVRARLDEPYRTLLGHLRHEIGHWYWGLLVDATPSLTRFRRLFGDETQDYGQALSRHYGSAGDPDWTATYVSHYATAHPWEDWAETFAHYLHIRDALQTSVAWGVSVAGPDLDLSVAWDAQLVVDPVDEADEFDELIRAWLPLTYALNAENRAMGKDDLYPFVLAPAVIDKLRFVHAVVTGNAEPDPPG